MRRRQGCIAFAALIVGGCLLLVWPARRPIVVSLPPLFDVAGYAPAACFLKSADGELVIAHSSTAEDGDARYGTYPLQILNQSGAVLEKSVGSALDCNDDGYSTGLMNLGDLDGDGRDDLGVACDPSLVVYVSNHGEWRLLGSVPARRARVAGFSARRVHGAPGAEMHSFIFGNLGKDSPYVVAQGYVNQAGHLDVFGELNMDPVGSMYDGRDYDGDGETDVLMAQKSGVAVYSPSRATVVHHATAPSNWHGVDAAACGDDLSGDGLPELYVGADQAYDPESVACLDPVADDLLWQWSGWVSSLSELNGYVHRRIYVVADADEDAVRDVVYVVSSPDLRDAVTIVVLSGATGDVLGVVNRIDGMRMSDVVLSEDGAVMVVTSIAWLNPGRSSALRLYRTADLLDRL